MSTARTEKKSPINIEDIIDEKYVFVRELGKGGFGAVYEVADKLTKAKYAMKVELDRPKKEEPGLNLEICVIKRLQRSGRKKFSGRVALQCFETIKSVHLSDLLHRDIKPTNFAIGKTDKDARRIFILDFGTVRRFRLKTGTLRLQRKCLGFRGTIKYASPNVHQRSDISRQDDLWSWLYMVFEFQRWSLPWRGITSKDEVAIMKLSARDESVSGLDREFALIYDNVAKIKWGEPPQYDWLRHTMSTILKKHKLSRKGRFDWEEGGSIYKEVKSVKEQPYEKLMKS